MDNHAGKVSTKTLFKDIEVTKEPKLRCVIRIEKDGTPALFYYDERKDLVCFTFNEGHSTACHEYYTRDTVGLNRHPDYCYYPEKIAELRKKFQDHYEDIVLDFKLTLSR